MGATRTKSGPRALDDQQLAAFRRDGFVFVPGFFDDSRTAEITGWIDELTALPEKPGKHWVYHEESGSEPKRRLIQRIEKFGEASLGEVGARFERLFHAGRLHMAVSELLAEHAVLFKEKINYKMAGGPGFKPHQDSQAGWGAYAKFFVTALVTIDASTPENGCLEMAAGWHTRGLVGEEWKPLEDATLARMEFRAFPAKPGDALFFDSFAPHRSGPNLTEQQRRVLYVTYNRASEGEQRERYFADKHRSFPPDIEREAGKSYVFRV